MKKYCEICGKKDITNNFINVFIDGNMSNNNPKNLMPCCVNCAKVWKIKRLYTAATTLHKLGFGFNRRMKWVYDRKVIRSELIDLPALEHQIEYLQKENRELKELLGIK